MSSRNSMFCIVTLMIGFVIVLSGSQAWADDPIPIPYQDVIATSWNGVNPIPFQVKPIPYLSDNDLYATSHVAIVSGVDPDFTCTVEAYI